MKILHCSDLHAYIPKLEGDFDLIVNSGDFLPDHKPRIKARVAHHQLLWVVENMDILKPWIGNKKFLFSSGNHDYMDPCEELKANGVDAVNIDNKLIEVNGIKFYGFPYVPYIGIWNWEKYPDEMAKEIDKLVDIVNSEKIDVLVAHCMPYDILDRGYDGNQYGNTLLKEAVDKKFKHKPKLCLGGHIHDANGLVQYGKTLFSNAARGQRIIEI